MIYFTGLWLNVTPVAVLAIQANVGHTVIMVSIYWDVMKQDYNVRSFLSIEIIHFSYDQTKLNLFQL